jgi:hypothetical protein
MNRTNLRRLPWLLAVAGVLVPLVGGGFATWPLAVVWFVVLAVIRLIGRLPPARSDRIILAAVALPILFLLAFEGGWWQIPAVVAWLLIEVTDRPAAVERPSSHASG